MSMGSPTAPEKVAQCMALLASGMAKADIAATTGVTVYAIKKLAQVPANKVLIEALRSAFKAQSSEAVEKIGPMLDGLIVKALEHYDPAKGTSAKDLDALFRARHALEKTSASVSGENKTIFQQSKEIKVTFAPWTKHPASAGLDDVVDAEVKALPASTAVDGDDDDDV